MMYYLVNCIDYWPYPDQYVSTISEEKTNPPLSLTNSSLMLKTPAGRAAVYPPAPPSCLKALMYPDYTSNKCRQHN